MFRHSSVDSLPNERCPKKQIELGMGNNFTWGTGVIHREIFI